MGANGGFGCTKEKRKLIVEKYEGKRGGLGSTVDLILYRNRRNCEKKDGVRSERWICLTKEKKVFLRKKMGFGANGGFEKCQKRQKKKPKKKPKKTFSGLSELLTQFT